MLANTPLSSNSHDRPDNAPAIVWFRDDLRIADNPALEYASSQNRPIIPLFIFETNLPEHAHLGGAQKWMLHHALKSLDANLKTLGARLILAEGDALEILQGLVSRHGAGSVYWNRRYTQYGIKTDINIKSTLTEDKIEARSFQAALLHEPSKILTAAGGPFKVYSPFWRAFERQPAPRPVLPKPVQMTGMDGIGSLEIDDFALLPTRPDWASGLRETWDASESGAQDCLDEFVANGLHGYAKGRDIPAKKNVSRLSPYLRYGLVSPYQLWHAAVEADAPENDKLKFCKELVWREFSYHLLYHFPSLGWQNFNSSFDDFPWLKESRDIKAWQKGKTGYPLVDAGMRELWHTGYMHNRVRMVTASFLIKHLMVDWRVGERWFWDTLVDADPASNTASWQWVAGSGADAAPYFRIFNPIIQGKKFDPDGTYVRKWVPELSGLPDKYLHEPWLAPEHVQEEAGIQMGTSYPFPIVDHKAARDRALDAYKNLKKEYAI
ncbi:MAG: deoxyribodipyrimidine photo-lyase [Pseudomonadota bacterium]